MFTSMFTRSSNLHYGRIGLCLVILMLSGCQKISYHHEYKRTQEMVNEVLDQSINVEQCSDFCEPVNELSRNRAIQIALYNNKKLQASYEELGISKADLLEAGLLKNPSISASFNIPDAKKNIRTNIEVEAPLLSLTDLWQIPRRKKVFKDKLEASIYGVVKVAFEIYTNTRLAYDTLMFTHALLENAQQTADRITLLRYDLKKRKEFGFASDLDISLAEVEVGTWELKITELKALLEEYHARLCLIMGLDPLCYPLFILTEKLATLIPSLPEKDELIHWALEHHYEIILARLQIKYYQDLIAYENSRKITECALGIAFKQDFDPHQSGIGPYVSAEVPLFNHNQAAIARAEFHLKKAEKEYQQAQLTVIANITAAYVRFEGVRENVSVFDKKLTLFNQQALKYTQEFHKQMQITLPTLLQTEAALYKTQRKYLQTLHHMLDAYTNLEMAVGKKLDRF